MPSLGMLLLEATSADVRGSRRNRLRVRLARRWAFRAIAALSMSKPAHARREAADLRAVSSTGNRTTSCAHARAIASRSGGGGAAFAIGNASIAEICVSCL